MIKTFNFCNYLRFFFISNYLFSAYNFLAIVKFPFNKIVTFCSIFLTLLNLSLSLKKIFHDICLKMLRLHGWLVCLQDQDGPANVFKRLSSLEDDEEEDEVEESAHAPPASVLHRRRALVPPKVSHLITSLILPGFSNYVMVF